MRENLPRELSLDPALDGAGVGACDSSGRGGRGGLLAGAGTERRERQRETGRLTGTVSGGLNCVPPQGS